MIQESILPESTRSVAVFSDVHGNIRALEAILDDIAAQNVDAIVCNGDMITSSAHSHEVVARIRALGIPSTRGNHERYLYELSHPDHPKWQLDNWAPTKHDYEILGADNRRWLAELPDSLCLCDGDAPLFMSHGLPGNDIARVTAQWLGEQWDELFANYEPGSTLVGSHLHWFYQHHHRGYQFVRTPSAGLPLNGNPRTSYVILRRQQRGWLVERRSLHYDLEGELASFRRSDYYAEGGLIAQLFWHELRTARWWIVPFFAHIRQIAAGKAIQPAAEGYTAAELKQYYASFDRAAFPEYEPDAPGHTR